MPPARSQFAPISQKRYKDGPLLPSFLIRPPSTGACRSDSVPSSGQPLAAPANQPARALQQEPDGGRASGNPVTPWPGGLGEEGCWATSLCLAANPSFSSHSSDLLMPCSEEDPEERPDPRRSPRPGPGGHLGAAAVTRGHPKKCACAECMLLLDGAPAVQGEEALRQHQH